MVSMSIIKLSSKGQIVIPAAMRENFKEGERFLMIKDDDRIILKKADKLSEKMKEDLEFAKRIEKSWKDYEKAKFKSMEFDDFIAAMKSW